MILSSEINLKWLHYKQIGKTLFRTVDLTNKIYDITQQYICSLLRTRKEAPCRGRKRARKGSTTEEGGERAKAQSTRGEDATDEARARGGGGSAKAAP